MIINTAHSGVGSGLEIFNFPLTISLAEPTPIATGHVWVVHDGPVDFNNIVLDDAVKVDYSNGYLMLIVDDTNNGQDTIMQLKKIGSAKVPLTSRRDTNNDTVLPWQAGSLNKGGNIIDIKRKYPRVYSRLNDVLDMETAYVWDGTQWVMVSQKGSYLAVGTNSTSAPSFLYNRADTTLTLHSDLPNFSKHEVRCIKWSPDGQFVFYAINGSPWLIGYQRAGDSFTKFSLVLPSDTIMAAVMDISISQDGNHMIAAMAENFNTTSNPSNYACLEYYEKQPDNSWSYIKRAYQWDGLGYGYGCDWSPDGNYCVFTSADSPYIRRFKKTGNTFTLLANPSALPGGACYRVKYSPDGQFVAVGTAGSPFVVCYHIVSDTQWNRIGSGSTFPSGTNPSYNPVFVKDSSYLIIIATDKLLFYTYSTDSLAYIGSKTISSPYSMAISYDGTKLAVGLIHSPYLRWYSLSGMALTELPAPDTLPTDVVYALDFLN